MHKLLDVGARDEDVGLAAPDEERSDARVLRQANQNLGQLDQDVAREFVDLFPGQVKGQDAEAVRTDVELKRAHIASTTMAPPWPPPIHIVASPNWTSRRRISLKSVVTRRFAEDPTG